MARRKSGNSSRSNGSSFQFIWVDFTDKQLVELRAHVSSPELTLEKCLYSLVEKGWKVSISENRQSGRFLVSITDKWDRQGCSGITWGVEHSDLISAVYGADFYAEEIIGDGIEGVIGNVGEDKW